MECKFLCWFPADEKEKYDPSAFRDALLQGFKEADGNLDQVSKFLDSAGSKLDYRRYAETLCDVLFAGGILGNWLDMLQRLILFHHDFYSMLTPFTLWNVVLSSRRIHSRRSRFWALENRHLRVWGP